MIKKRTTVYLDRKLIKLLKLHSLRTEQSMSEYISRVVYQDLMEEQKDLVDIKRILKEPTVSFDKMLEELNISDDV